MNLDDIFGKMRRETFLQTENEKRANRYDNH